MKSIKIFVCILLIVVAGCGRQEERASGFSPKDVVSEYFHAWNDKDYGKMYSFFSDGFKKLEPTAKDESSFETYAVFQGIKNVNVIGIKEVSNDGSTAKVEYAVEFIFASGKKPFKSTFTLKYRKEDIVPGWKMIHPYGKNSDES